MINIWRSAFMFLLLTLDEAGQALATEKADAKAAVEKVESNTATNPHCRHCLSRSVFMQARGLIPVSLLKASRRLRSLTPNPWHSWPTRGG